MSKEHSRIDRLLSRNTTTCTVEKAYYLERVRPEYAGVFFTAIVRDTKKYVLSPNKELVVRLDKALRTSGVRVATCFMLVDCDNSIVCTFGDYKALTDGGEYHLLTEEELKNIEEVMTVHREHKERPVIWSGAMCKYA
jgi:hypothetical protein